MKLLIVSDVWDSSETGFVRNLEALAGELGWMGHEVLVAGPEVAATIPCPGRPRIRLAVRPAGPLERLWRSFSPDAVHIATEGPMGVAARKICLVRGFPFTSSHHAAFPVLLRSRLGLPGRAAQAYLRWFHAPARVVLAEAPLYRKELEACGLDNVSVLLPGVDARVFRPRAVPAPGDPRPIWLYVGQLASGACVEEFLSLPLPGSKWVAGDGPKRARLESRFPSARFWGQLRRDSLVRLYSTADALVHPGRGGSSVILEALACGLPVAARPGLGPDDLGEVAAVEADLGRAARNALTKSREACRAFALRHTWRECAARFLAVLAKPERPLAV